MTDSNLERNTQGGGASSVGTLPDDRRDPAHEPERMTAENWEANNYYAAEISADPGDAVKRETYQVMNYENYLELRKEFHDRGYYIVSEIFFTESQYFPGLLTYEDALGEFDNADDSYIELENFPIFSAAAKIQKHDTIILAADTGAGKSSLSLNFINDLNAKYPVLYFNLEMDNLTVLRRLVAIRTGLDLDSIEDYKKSEATKTAVKSALRAITSRKPLQILNDVYTLEEIEVTIKNATRSREEPTIVIIDHSLLVTTQERNGSRYERFTRVSEELRRMARLYNIVVFELLQQNRAGKEDEGREPTNSSLKESGSWENDATKVCFLWYDPNARRKKIIISKNRNGDLARVTLDYEKKTQIYREAKEQEPSAKKKDHAGNTTKRNQDRERLEDAVKKAITKAGTKPTLMQVADADGALDTAKIRKWVNELGGYSIIQVGDKPSPEDLIERCYTKLSEQEANEAGNPWGEESDIIG